MQFKQPIHGYCDAEVYNVVVPVALSVGEITVNVTFNRKTGEVYNGHFQLGRTQAFKECPAGRLHYFNAPKIVLRKAEVIARQFAGDALPPQVSSTVN